MRVVLLCHKFWPSVGGLQTYTQQLAHHLQSQGHDVEVFTTRSPASAPARERLAPNLVVNRFATRLANHFPLQFMPRLLFAAASARIRSADVLHSVGYTHFPAVLGYWAATVFDRPHVLTPVFMLNPDTWQRRLYDQVLGRRVVHDAQRALVQSSREADLLRAHGFVLPEYDVIPFGVDAAQFERQYDVAALDRELRAHPDEKILLFVGKIMSAKGVFNALDALRLALDRGLGVRLVMVGDLHDREHDDILRRIGELRLDPHVTLPGAVANEDGIARYYQVADAVLFPSQFEQFGIVAIEAAGSGRPILGTPVGVMQDLIPRHEIGLLHSFDDVEQLADNMRRVLEDPTYRANAVRVRSAILREFDWGRIAERTEAVYAGLVGAPAGGGG